MSGTDPGPATRAGAGPSRLVFVAGLHRSGTTPLARVLSEHPQVSGFSGTGATEDEGQHLQDVYPPARVHGGSGKFAFSPAAHLTEDSPLASPASAQRLMEQWSPYWDLSRPVLVEKSPANLLMTRFLQALFPQARFVVVVRHPVVVALSTRKWVRGTSLRRLVEHWLDAHDLLRVDAPYVRQLHVLSYEHLVGDPVRTLDAVRSFLGLEGDIPSGTVDARRSSRYEQEWEQLRASRNPLQRRQVRRIEQELGPRVAAYGYDLEDLSVARGFPELTSP